MSRRKGNTYVLDELVITYEVKTWIKKYPLNQEEKIINSLYSSGAEKENLILLQYPLRGTMRSSLWYPIIINLPVKYTTISKKINTQNI